MKQHVQHFYAGSLAIILLVLLDEFIKYKSLMRLPEEGSLVDPGILAFAIHKNYGIAFDIPFSLWLIISFSILIGFVLLRIAYQNRQTHPDISFMSLMIVIGAMGNLYDRIIYGFTVDYIILFERLAINLSDIVIVAGVIGLLLTSRRSKQHHHIHPNEPRR